MTIPIRAADLPNPALTPGSINPLVTQSNIRTTICVPGYTATIRPSSGYTTNLKLTQFRLYGITNALPSQFEEDHLIALELGGNPIDSKNLWPEPWKSVWNAHMKDHLENVLHSLVCSGKVPLAVAQHDIATNWILAYHKYIK